MRHTLDACKAIKNLAGTPPVIINDTNLTLEHVMQRLDAIERKMITNETIEELDKKLHNHITQLGSRVGMSLKTLKEKDTIIDERVEHGLSRIDEI